MRGGVSPATSHKPNIIYTHHVKEEYDSYSSTTQYGGHHSTIISSAERPSTIPSATLATQPQKPVPTAVLATQPQQQVPTATLATHPQQIPSSTLSTQPPSSPSKQQQIPVITTQTQPELPQSTLATRPPSPTKSGVKNPLSILSKLSVLADKEKADAVKKPEPTATNNLEHEPVKQIKIEREPTVIPVTKPVVVKEDTIVSQTIISTIHENNNVIEHEVITTPPKVTKEPSSLDFTGNNFLNEENQDSVEFLFKLPEYMRKNVKIYKFKKHIPSNQNKFLIGIRLKRKKNVHEIGQHLISKIESESYAAKERMRDNCYLLKLNEIFCENKTHEFVVSYLSYLIDNENIKTIKIFVYEPHFSASNSILISQNEVSNANDNSFKGIKG